MFKKYRLFIAIGLIVLLGFFLAPTGTLKPIKNIFYQITKPFTLVGYYSFDRLSIFFKNLTHLASLSKENQKLIKENLELQSQLSLLKEAQHENEILKKEIGFYQSRKDLKLLPANIISRSITGYLKTVVIDRGQKDGLKVGQAIVSSGYLVGTIKEAFEDTAEISLITNFNSLVPVILQESRGTGLLRGGFGGLTVEDIPLNITINHDEQIVTSGLGGDMPFGILVGKVGEIISKKGEIFQKVTVESPMQIYYLEFVFVVG